MASRTRVTRRQGARLRLRSWLKRQIDGGEFTGLEWMDREKQMFRVPWKHASRQNWNLRDVGLFQGWAMYTGKYKDGKDKPDPKRWKTNFRCALNALPDIEHVPEEDSTRGQDAYRVYIMKPMNKKRKLSRDAKLRKSEKSEVSNQVDIPVLTPPPSSESEQESDQEIPTETEIVQIVDEMSQPLDSGIQLFNSSSNTNDDLLPFGFLPLFYQSVSADWYCHLETDKVRVERSAV